VILSATQNAQQANPLLLVQGLHWIWPSVAGALFGFGLGSISDACLTLVIDSYVEVRYIDTYAAVSGC
jgi:hypothetical protein